MLYENVWFCTCRCAQPAYSVDPCIVQWCGRESRRTVRKRWTFRVGHYRVHQRWLPEHAALKCNVSLMTARFVCFMSSGVTYAACVGFWASRDSAETLPSARSLTFSQGRYRVRSASEFSHCVQKLRLASVMNDWRLLSACNKTGLHQSCTSSDEPNASEGDSRVFFSFYLSVWPWMEICCGKTLILVENMTWGWLWERFEAMQLKQVSRIAWRNYSIFLSQQ